MQRKSTNRWSYAVLAAVSSLYAAPMALGTETCPANPFGGPDICVDWTGGGTPTAGTHFLIDYFTNSAYPKLTLIAGSAWNVRSKNSDDTPGHIGALLLNPDVSSDDFG